MVRIGKLSWRVAEAVLHRTVGCLELILVTCGQLGSREGVWCPHRSVFFFSTFVSFSVLLLSLLASPNNTTVLCGGGK